MKESSVIANPVILGIGIAALSFTLSSCIDDPYYHSGNRSNRSSYSSYGKGSSRYTYYPRQQVYYDNHSHQYTYQQNSHWLTQKSPPKGFHDSYRSSPSVHMNFDDEPSRHHSSVSQQYPRQWSDNRDHKSKDDGKHNTRDKH